MAIGLCRNLSGGGGITKFPSEILESKNVYSSTSTWVYKDYGKVDLTKVNKVIIPWTVTVHFNEQDSNQKYYYNYAQATLAISNLPTDVNVKSKEYEWLRDSYTCNYSGNGSYEFDVSDLKGEYYIVLRTKVRNALNESPNYGGYCSFTTSGVGFSK